MLAKLKRKGDDDSPVYEAARLDQTNVEEILKWIDSAAIVFAKEQTLTFVNGGGSATLSPGDWVLKGPGGKFYPTCRRTVKESFIKV